MVTDAVFAVPAYGPQNDVTLKMPAFEWVHVQLHQQKGMISLSPPTICNSAQIFDYLRPDFHPNDHDTTEYLEYYKDKLLKEGGAIAPYFVKEFTPPVRLS
ncbi:hypothetical protein J780_4054 [Acinetobacter baumannii 25253_7]|nr:hypothetical protein J780_4054 [Acinetobacter baumannii 25253_7]